MSRTRWLLGSVGVGTVIALLRLSVEPGMNVPTIGQRDFERGLAWGDQKEGSLADITVLPEQGGKTKVLARELCRAGAGAGGGLVYRQVAFVAERPYQSGIWEGNPTDFPDVSAYLDLVLSGKNAKGFRYAWWDQDWAIYATSVGASVLLLGLLLPATLDFLNRRRFGPGEEEAATSLWGVRSTARASEKSRSPTDLTEEEQAKLAALNAQLEDSVGSGPAAGPEERPPEQAAPPRPLESIPGPSEAVDTDAAAQAEREYSGEFYPVAKPDHPTPDGVRDGG